VASSRKLLCEASFVPRWKQREGVDDILFETLCHERQPLQGDGAGALPLWGRQPVLIPTVAVVLLHNLYFGLGSKSIDEAERINEAPEDPHWELCSELLRTRSRPSITDLCTS